MTATGQEIVCQSPAAGCECAECRELDHDEELQATDLEERLDAAFERSERQGDLIEMFRREI